MLCVEKGVEPFSLDHLCLVNASNADDNTRIVFYEIFKKVELNLRKILDLNRAV